MLYTTHTPELQRTGNLDYVGSVGWTGKRFSSWNNWVHGNRKVSVRSDERKETGKESLPLGERYNCSLLSPCPFTHPHKVRCKQDYSTVQLAKHSSLAAHRSSYSSGLDRDKDQTSLISKAMVASLYWALSQWKSFILLFFRLYSFLPH